MKNLIESIKSNPLVAASAIVAVLSIFVLGYFYFVAAPGYSADKSEILKEQKQKQDSLMRVSVPLPNKDPNAPADMEQVVINPTVIREVGDIYNLIQTHYEDILVTAKEKNAKHHLGVLLGGTAIWPDANPTQNFDLYVRAASDYKNHFKAVFDVTTPNNWNMPIFSAGSPPTRSELEMILGRSAFEFISSVGAQNASDLSQSQAEQLFAEQRMTLMNALNLRANQINFYASLPPEEDRFKPAETEGTPPAGGPTPGAGFGGFGAPAGGAAATPDTAAEYPFQIAPWAFADQPPTPDQLWEGQVQLWVMRDIMIAINQTNRVGQKVKVVGPDGVIREQSANVTNSPIKRLLELKTLTGYVGLHNTGAALGGVVEDTGFGASPVLGGGAFAGPGDAGSAPGTNTPSVYPTVPTELIGALSPKQTSDRAAEHFGITPTGRISNSVFDVRHTQLVIDIEATELPAFLESLRQTNFMTVIKSEITDLDEYELLKEGYVYGHNDVVRASLVIESLWFRNWTEEFMPKIVKEKLLIIQPVNAVDQSQQFNEFE
ncbi:MAG: hypothetical protein AB8C95_04715 [Phycisphaeraceae bacterium]